MVKNLFKKRNILDVFDKSITSKAIGEDLEFIGLNISKKTYSTIKIYISLLAPLIYMLISIVTIEDKNYLLLALYSLTIFLIIFIFTDFIIRVIVKFTQLRVRFEFVNFLGAWSRNIELGANFISSLEKSSELVQGTLKKLINDLIKDIHASTPLNVAIAKFGQACRDKELIDFCQSMASDIKDGADVTKYIIDTNKRIQNDKVNIINANTNNWQMVLSTLTGIIIFFSFAVYLMLHAIQAFQTT